MFLEASDRVPRARRLEPAHPAQPWREHDLV